MRFIVHIWCTFCWFCQPKRCIWHRIRVVLIFNIGFHPIINSIPSTFRNRTHKYHILKSKKLFHLFANINLFNLQSYKMKSRHPFLDIDIEIPKNTMDAVDSIRSWLSFQPHLPKLNGEF